MLIKRRLGWRRHVYYLRKNVTPPRVLLNTIPKKTIERIRAHNWADVALVRYATQLLEGAIQLESPAFEKELRRFQRVNTMLSKIADWSACSKLRRHPNVFGIRLARELAHKILK